MKYSVVRKINLANINKEVYAFETEDIGVHNADSFEEAAREADRLVAERVGYYRAKSEMGEKPSPGPVEVGPGSVTPPVAPTPVAPPSTAPAAQPAPAPATTPPDPSVSSQPPADLA